MAAKSIKKHLKVGPGGRRCPCCFPPPGKARRALYRKTKRAERNHAMKEEAKT